MGITNTVIADEALGDVALKKASAIQEEVRDKAFALGKTYDTTTGKIVTTTKEDDFPSPTLTVHKKMLSDQTSTIAMKIIPVSTEKHEPDTHQIVTGTEVITAPVITVKEALTPSPSETTDVVKVVVAICSSEEIDKVKKAEPKLLTDSLLREAITPKPKSPLRSPLRSPLKSPSKSVELGVIPSPDPYLTKTSPTARVVV